MSFCHSGMLRCKIFFFFFTSSSQFMTFHFSDTITSTKWEHSCKTFIGFASFSFTSANLNTSRDTFVFVFRNSINTASVCPLSGPFASCGDCAA